MAAFTVIVEETICQEFVVDASDAEDAATIARQRYRSGEFVLEPGELQSARLCVLDERGQMTGWENV